MKIHSLVLVVCLLLASCAIFSTVPRARADVIVTITDQTENRAIGETYQNTTGYPIFIKAMFEVDGSDVPSYVDIELIAGSESPEFDIDWQCYTNLMGGRIVYLSSSGFVPKDNWYALYVNSPEYNCILMAWIEWTISDNCVTGPQGPPGENGLSGETAPGAGPWYNWLRDSLVWLGEGGRYWLGITALLVAIMVICWVFLRDD
jgi:hypothetical protein